MCWLAILALIVGVADAGWAQPALQPPFPASGSHQAAKEPSPPQNTAPAAQPDQRGTESSPLSVKLLNTGESQAETAEKTKRENDNSSQERWVGNWTIGLTIALVFATMLQFFALLYQGYWLRRSVRIAEAALTSAEQAFLFQHSVVIIPIKDPDGFMRGWQFIFGWKNSGSTPARRVFLHTSFHMVLKPDPVADSGDLPPNFDFPDTYGFREPTEQVQLSIGPQGEMASNPKTIDVLDLDEAYSRRMRIFMYGWADYTDIFPKTPRHRTEFCFEIVVASHPDEEVTGRSPFLFFAYGPHNGAEDECYRNADEKARQVPYDTPIWPPPTTT
jgi:hypothetical protein